MTEAVRGVLAFIFGNMNTPRVEACVHPRNIASQRLLKKLDFTKEGLLRKYWFNNQTNEYDDMIMFSYLTTPNPSGKIYDI